MRLTKEEIGQRAERSSARRRPDQVKSKLKIEIIDGESVIGGGAAPSSVLPTRLLALSCDRPECGRNLRAPARLRSPDHCARRGRTSAARFRTVFPDQDPMQSRPRCSESPLSRFGIEWLFGRSLHHRTFHSPDRRIDRASAGACRFRPWSTSARFPCRGGCRNSIVNHWNKLCRRPESSYLWMKDLGGYRKKTLEDSPNIALRNPSFRNYADYMLTPEFEPRRRRKCWRSLKVPAPLTCAPSAIFSLPPHVGFRLVGRARA